MKVHILKQNVCVIEVKGAEYLQSYSTLVAYKAYGPDAIIIKHGQPQSVTTAKHISQWIGEPYKQALKSGRAIYGDIPEI